MPCKQYFTQSIGFLFYSIIEIIWTFLSTQNILDRQGNKSFFTWKIFVPPKVNLVRFEQYCIVSLSSFLYTLLEQIRKYLSLQNILFSEGAGTFLRKSPKPLKTSKCVRFGQFCTKPFASFCVVFIKTFWTFLSLQNIYLE